MAPDVGRPDRLIVISEAEVATSFVAVLLPPAVVPPLVSFVAPVVTDAVVVAGAVGVPDTEQEIDAPIATVAGVVGVQVPTVTPTGRPEIEHVAFAAVAVAEAEFVQRMVPE